MNNGAVELFCIAWRKALRRLLGLPGHSHSFLLPILSDTLPILDEICKRTARFITSCLFSEYNVVQKLVRYCIVEARYDSIVGANALYLCNRFNWALNDFLAGFVGLQNHFFHGLLCAMAY